MADELLGAALEIARAAGALAAARFAAGAPVRRKPDGTEVTPADVEVERLIRGMVAERFPDDGTLGEEEGEVAGTTGRRWVIDPINGTMLFARQDPGFNVLLSVEERGEPVASVIAYPITGQICYASRGGGAWRRVGDGSPEPLRVSDRRQLHGSGVQGLNIGTWSEELLLALHREVFLLPPVEALAVYRGEAVALVIAGFPMDYSDVAPLPLLIGEAGGRVTDLRGGDVLTGPGHVLASNGHLHDELLDLVRDLPLGRRTR